MQLNKGGGRMIDKNALKQSLDVHGITVQGLADTAGVTISTVYRWLAHPERITIGTVELIKDVTKMDRHEFLRIFYPH